MRNYKEEYQLWLDSPNLSEKEWEELKSIADDERKLKAAFSHRSSSVRQDSEAL